MATPDMCVYCFDALVAHFDKGPVPPPSFANQSFPLFVTWNKASKRGDGGDLRLRGCIGTFSGRPLHTGLHEYAVTSAIKDTRFDPVSKAEVSQLHCSVSLLTNFEEAPSVWDWDIGTHGIWIDFKDPSTGVHRNATYLPEVTSEQGWTKEEALESLVRKGGYKGRLTPELCAVIKLTRYQSSKHSLSYAEYCEIRKTRDGTPERLSSSSSSSSRR
eukprot:TRINITY_DN6098_c0_g1_i3.p1 TRINITY_DN6098_c0_g1~~TRINITY_DN6098_c0_g1_i3.p1  ORF type:complete len:238 (+),score=23.21 TRINITY_DN6098_c0_g1_i3:67-714(+)